MYKTKIKAVKDFNGKTYTCPHCKEKQESINQWQTCSVGYEYDFDNRSWEMKDINDGDFEAWACPSCGVDLSIPKKMEKIIQ